MGVTKNNEPSTRLDWLKWLIIAVILVAGIAANTFYSDVAWALRAAVGIVVFAGLLFIAAQTAVGHHAWNFIKGSRGELRKVVWPTRQETIQTTIIVAVMVVIVAILLWGIDSFLIWAISWLTGQRG